MVNPLLSVCVITYNHVKFIQQAIDSVLMQKVNFVYELIIADDCSTDGTREILNIYKNKFPAIIKLILQEKNVGSTKNFLDVKPDTVSKYVAYLEGDDYWTDPYKLQKQVEFLEANPQYSMCFTNSIVVDSENKILKNERVPEDKRRNLTQKDILSGYCPPINTALVKAELPQKYLPYFSGLLNGDFFISSLSTQHGDAGYLDINSAAYRMHSNGIWSASDDDYRTINFIKLNRRLAELVVPENKHIALNNIQASYKKLNKFNTEEDFLDKSFWTPQTAMLRAIRNAVLRIDGYPKAVLSIDKNPTLEKILLLKWPETEISVAKWPEYDVQNLHQYNDESFDIVYSHQVLEHVPKPWLAGKEIVRVLKKGGLGIHTTCAYNPRHGYPAFKDYYRFLPDGLAELFEGVSIWEKNGWGSKQALIYNLTIDDGNGELGGRRFVEALGKQNDENYPWHTWIVFQKN
jgi:glycosyltransferase involved in cell wall biosynthesis